MFIQFSGKCAACQARFLGWEIYPDMVDKIQVRETLI
jgi:hypothetical protein